jgi:hypothetical protein
MAASQLFAGMFNYTSYTCPSRDKSEIFNYIPIFSPYSSRSSNVTIDFLASITALESALAFVLDLADSLGSKCQCVLVLWR